MTVFYCTSFTGHYPVGVSAIVRAEDADSAAQLLNIELKNQGLPGDAEPKDMKPMPDDGKRMVVVLQNGDY